MPTLVSNRMAGEEAAVFPAHTMRINHTEADNYTLHYSTQLHYVLVQLHSNENIQVPGSIDSLDSTGNCQSGVFFTDSATQFI